MGVATQVITFSDIYTEILNRMRQVTTVTAITNQAQRYANMALQDFVMGFEYKLPWLERDAVLRTHGDYTTGTVAVTRGSTTVTGTDTLWTTVNSYNEANARATGKLILAGGANIHTIASVDSATQITLDDRYVADSDLAAGSTYIYFEDEYALASDFLKIIDWRIFSLPCNIELIARNDFRWRFPRPRVGGIPYYATILDKGFIGNTTPVQYVQFYPYPATELMIPYTYITNQLAVSSTGTQAVSMVADSDEPNMPIRYRTGIVLHAIYMWYRDKKDDARMQSAQADYIDFINRVVADQNMGAPTIAQLVPGNRYHNSYKLRPYSGYRRRW
jgi:hypothetical protein